jgi:uncharacterized cupredoxin-like copper-binding protein
VFTTLAGVVSGREAELNYSREEGTQMRSRTWLLVAGATAVAGLLFAGCGSSKGSDAGTTAAAGSQSSTTSGGAGLTVKMGDYSFTPSNPTVKAGKVTITSPNDGQVEHEMVVLKTDRNPASLPVHGNEVDEEGLEAKGVENAGEIEEVGPGQTKSTDFNLTPGKYVMICNVPGHYKLGMYGSITVK